MHCSPVTGTPAWRNRPGSCPDSGTGCIKPRRRYIAAGAALAILAAGYLWYALFSPFGYQPPDTLAAIDAAGPHAVFVYGTLRYRPVRWLVVGRTDTPVPAVLPGYRRDALDITPAAGESVRGMVIDVDADQLQRLDRYERLGIRYDRVRVTLDDGTGAWAYRRITDDG